MSLMVGVSGIRGVIGETLFPEIVLQFAQAYGTLLRGGRIALARDSRPSGEMFEAAAAAGLIAAGCRVTRLGIAMTPTVGFAIREGGYEGAVSITASHNPGEWNGVKFLDELGLAPDPQRAAEIARIRAERAYDLRPSAFAAVQSDPGVGARHAQAVLDVVETDLAPIRGLSVLLDSVNGAGCLHSPDMLRRMGCEVIHLNGEPTGRFGHPPEPIAENLRAVSAAVRERKAAVGFVQDPDADRLALIDERGEFIGEEYTLALATQAVLSQRVGPVAANLSTSRMVDVIAERFGARVIRTPVGEAHVARAMLRAECVVGGEGNGGVIDPRITFVRDSLSAMSLVLQLMAATQKKLSELVAGLPRFAMVKQKFECPRERIDAAVERLSAAFADERLDRSDGVRIDFADGWAHLRASNTEPIVRVSAEAEGEAQARELIERVRKAAGF